MFMVNANEEIGRGDEYIIEMLKNVKTPVFLVLNKIDLVHPDELMPKIQNIKVIWTLQRLYSFQHYKG